MNSIVVSILQCSKGLGAGVESFTFEMVMTYVRINQECASMDGTQAGPMASTVEPTGG